ncbi:MAG TPA: hypothetical protein VMU05_18775 [Dongiaceae bacterium]|nr:hypothetical protein [Dongiaceae bacterium]
MAVDRRSVLKAIPAVAGSALVAPIQVFATELNLTIEPSKTGPYCPLDEIRLRGASNGTVVVKDAAGQQYVRGAARDPFAFKVSGVLGIHTASVLNPQGAPIASISFEVDCETEIREESGVYQGLLTDIEWTMMDWNQEAPVNVIRYKDRIYQLFVNWIFDHTLTLKGMKYYWHQLKDAVDFFADTQREDGMIWENCYPATPEANYFDWKFGYDNFVRKIEGGFRQLRRAPVESHVEQFYIEALYYTWKATGDDEWMKPKLDGAIRAIRFLTKDPYRWSQKYQLVHRGFTIDTWDFTSDDQQKIGSDCVFVVYLGKSEFGIFYGDNTNMVAACRRLYEMLTYAGRKEEAKEFFALAEQVQERLDKLAWNGEFYTHWIAENPGYKPDVGVDMTKQVSLSNAYSINRGISHDKCVAILRTYQRIRSEMPTGSPGEFYGIYPPFLRDFGENAPGLVWEYVNGGVLSCVAGELARGAFEHGFEEYGADILRRQKAIAERYRGYLPVTLRGKPAETPKRTFETLDLRKIANVDLGPGNAGVPGWIGDREPNHNLAGFPTGAQEFHGIPFDAIPPESNGHRACVGIAQSSPYTQQATVSVQGKAGSVYLLHTGAGPEGTFGTFTIRYADGSSFSEYIESRKNIGSWWEPADSRYAREGPRVRDRLRVAWQTSAHGLPALGVYVAGFDNPHPDREISSLDFSAGIGETKWLLLGVTLCSTPVFFAPYDDLSSGIPDGWNAAVAYALLEGLAGVEDRGTAFSRTRIAPRWIAADVHLAEVTLKYPASGGYCRYRYTHEKTPARVAVEFTGTGRDFELHVLLPKEREVAASTLDGKPISPRFEKIEQSIYAVTQVSEPGVHRLILSLR